MEENETQKVLLENYNGWHDAIYDIVSVLKKPGTNNILEAVGNILDKLNSVTGTSEALALKLKKYRHGYIEGSLGDFYAKFLAGIWIQLLNS